ncbi:MAG: anti-sigma regulatory factor [Acidimicrobiales bacterium]
MMDVEGAEVRLTMPASPPLLRVARLTAAGLAGRLGFSLDEIEDTKIAVDELCFAVVGSRGRSGTLTLVYRLGRDHLTIEGRGAFEVALPAPAPNELSSKILAVVADEHELSSGPGATWFRLLKRGGRG